MRELTKKRLRRSWSEDEKRSICGQARVPGVSVAQVARRYAMNANLIFNWLSDLPPERPSFITRVCAFCFHSLWHRIEQARRARNPHSAQAPGALQRVSYWRVMSAA